MSPSLQPVASVRPAAAVNEDIRRLVTACGGWLYGETRERYEQLVAEWAAAKRAEAPTAA